MIELAQDASWCWFGDSRGLHYNGKSYYGWVDRQGRVMVGQYDPADGTRRRFQVGGYLNSQGGPMLDDHGNPSLVMRGGRLVALWSWHGGASMLYRVADVAESIESFGPQLVCSAGNTAGGSGFTYPNPVDLTATNGYMYLFWRGGNFQPAYTRGNQVVANGWQPARWLFSVPSPQRPYMKVLGDDTQGSIHFALTDGHPRDVATSIFYARLDVAAGNFRRADGTVAGTVASVDAGTPVAVSSLERVYDGRSNGQPGWVWDVQLDAGRPVIAFATVPSRSGHAYHVARWSGAAWQVDTVASGGGTISQDNEVEYSGGIVVDPADPARVVLSRPDSPAEWQRLESWRNTASGVWTLDEALTDGARQNVRPYFLRGADGTVANRLMWLSGSYQTYVDYDTDLVAEGG